MPFGTVTDIKMSRLNLIRTTHINLFFLPDFCLGVKGNEDYCMCKFKQKIKNKKKTETSKLEFL